MRTSVAPGVTFDPESPSVGGTPLFIIQSGNGCTCLGLEVARKKAADVLRWLEEVSDLSNASPAEVWAAYTKAMSAGAAHHKTTGKKCLVDLKSELIGLEGMRVEVLSHGEPPRRFIVGRSNGWMPCHLEIARRNSTGGSAAYLPPGSIVRVVSR